MNRKFKLENLIYLCIVLYCILPNYIKIKSIPLNYIFSLLAILLIIYVKKNLILSKRGCRFFVFINILMIIPMIYHKEYIGGFTTFITNVALIISLFYYLDSKEKFIALINKLIIGAFILEIISIFEFALKINIFELFASNYTFIRDINSYRFGFLRISSSFYNSINYCIFLFFISMILRYKSAIRNNRVKYTKFDRMVYIITLLCATLTMSRGVLLIMIALNIFMYSISTNINQKIKSVILLSSLSIIIIGFIQMIGIDILQIIESFINMILSVFSKSAQAKITNSFGTNVQGLGNRLDLFNWVVQDIHGYEILGKGVNTSFEYIVNEYGHKKTSIENQYLLQLFRYGYVGLSMFIVMFINLLKIQIGNLKLKIFGEKISFLSIMLLITMAYLSLMFMVSVGEEVKLFYILIVLMFSYIYNLNKGESRI